MCRGVPADTQYQVGAMEQWWGGVGSGVERLVVNIST